MSLTIFQERVGVALDRTSPGPISVVEGKANFMAVGWVSRVNFKPPLMAVALGPHHTNKGIEETGQFSINIPDVSLMEKTDYCGLVSGSHTDKSELCTVLYGDLV